MHWLLIGYMFLFIDRPFEVWPWLGELHLERAYMLLTMAVWVIYPHKRWLPNPLHAAYAAFALAVIFAWIISPYADHGQPVVEDWFKIVVFYLLLVTTVHDEAGLKRLTMGFLAVMGLYLLHSFREYLGGRHTFRMGIARMIGVDTSLGDPNSFGASIVFALPLVTAFWNANVGGRLGKLLLLAYVGLSSLCILLTGSRSSFLGLLVWFLIVILSHHRRGMFLFAFMMAAPMAFLMLPESLQNRFETIINPDVGPANAEESSQGRIKGFFTGLELWQAHPLAGVGPGAWRPATHSKLESHNLYGQLLGELGTVGLISFLALLATYWLNLRRIKRIRHAFPQWHHHLPFQLATSLGMALFLLLFMGNFGHNLFRFTWLWYGGFLIIAQHCIRRRLDSVDNDEPYEHDEAFEDQSFDGDETDLGADDLRWADDELEPGWVRHPGHATVARP